MEKDFDKWNILKKRIEKQKNHIYAKRREIWWCYLGVNIGSEICGKNKIFERPVLVLKVFNKHILLIIPLTTKDKGIFYHVKLDIDNQTSFAMFEQIKVISSKRLSRKIGRLNAVQFNSFIAKYRQISI